MKPAVHFLSAGMSPGHACTADERHTRLELGQKLGDRQHKLPPIHDPAKDYSTCPKCAFTFNEEQLTDPCINGNLFHGDAVLLDKALHLHVAALQQLAGGWIRRDQGWQRKTAVTLSPILVVGLLTSGSALMIAWASTESPPTADVMTPSMTCWQKPSSVTAPEPVQQLPADEETVLGVSPPCQEPEHCPGPHPFQWGCGCWTQWQ